MQWGEIRDLVVARMNEYAAGDPEVAASASYTDTLVYKRISIIFRELVGDVAEIDPTKVCDLVSMSYAADTVSVQLAAALRYRPIHTCELLLPDGVTYEPIERVNYWQDAKAREWDAINTYFPSRSRYAYRIEKDLIYIMPRPPQDLSLRLRYLKEIADITSGQSASSPDFIPSEQQPHIALKTAISLLRENGGNASLEQELEESRAKFLKWASFSPKPAGPRFVHEFD